MAHGRPLRTIPRQGARGTKAPSIRSERATWSLGLSLQLFYCLCRSGHFRGRDDRQTPSGHACRRPQQGGWADPGDPPSRHAHGSRFPRREPAARVDRHLPIRKPSHRVTFSLPFALSSSLPRRGTVLPTIGETDGVRSKDLTQFLQEAIMLVQLFPVVASAMAVSLAFCLRFEKCAGRIPSR